MYSIPMRCFGAFDKIKAKVFVPFNGNPDKLYEEVGNLESFYEHPMRYLPEYFLIGLFKEYIEMLRTKDMNKMHIFQYVTVKFELQF
jgi:uncharacterized sodium:solute symporter family permease YidK